MELDMRMYKDQCAVPGKGTRILALALALATATAARAEEPDVSPATLDRVITDASAGGGGVAPGEVPDHVLPFQKPTAPATEPAPAPAAMDLYGQWNAAKESVKKATGTEFGLYINPSYQAIVQGP